jgi:hypothetical protein
MSAAIRIDLCSTAEVALGNAHMNERDFPHIVELELPLGGFRSQSLEFDAFSKAVIVSDSGRLSATPERYFVP